MADYRDGDETPRAEGQITNRERLRRQREAEQNPWPENVEPPSPSPSPSPGGSVVGEDADVAASTPDAQSETASDVPPGETSPSEDASNQAISSDPAPDDGGSVTSGSVDPDAADAGRDQGTEAGGTGGSSSRRPQSGPGRSRSRHGSHQENHGK